MAALRAKDKGVGDVATDQNVLSKFREYDLEELGIPVSARPRVNSVYTGQHGYTIRSARGGATWYSKLVSVFFLGSQAMVRSSTPKIIRQARGIQNLTTQLFFTNIICE